jgi:tRNA pseudouridine32 synthase/23S rRNA pseudouridine746 synthase
VHRLDMSTSGLMLIAKTKEVHKSLQRQFINRSVKKLYVAVLDGIIAENEGVIDLPLRVDLDNRPQQMVCEEHGKRAITHWKVLERKVNTTRIQFSPITGRTHQLRVHAAHPLGLNTAILGDDLYGTVQNRLLLHAESIAFRHPITKELLCISQPAEF